MAFVGGFLGGGVEMVPAGQGQLCLQWLTPDRLNMDDAVFHINGIGSNINSFTVPAGSDGRAEKIVPTGEYEVSVDHRGYYANDGPQKVIVRSAESYLMLFVGVSQKMNVHVQLNEPEAAVPGDIWIREEY